MTPTDPKSAARKEASWLVSIWLTTTDLALDSRQYSLLRESITDAIHAKNERIQELEEGLKWYAGSRRPEDRLNDNGDKARAALLRESEE